MAFANDNRAMCTVSSERLILRMSRDDQWQKDCFSPKFSPNQEELALRIK